MTHTCHWPGCNQPVQPRFWGCYRHWRKLPAHLRERIWAYYRRGQEIDQKPSPEYIAVAREVQEWCEAHPEVR